MTVDPTITTFLTKISQLQEERGEYVEKIKVIDNKIAALDLAYEVIAGKPRDATTAARRRSSGKGSKRPKSGYDPNALARTLLFVNSRKRLVTPTIVAHHFRITTSAANSRLGALTRQGVIRRIARGKYNAITTTAPAGTHKRRETPDSPTASA